MTTLTSRDYRRLALQPRSVDIDVAVDRSGILVRGHLVGEYG